MSSGFYKQLCEHALDLILCVTPAREFVYVNPAWQSAMGYSQEEAETLTLTDPDRQIMAANDEACRIFQATEAELCQSGRALVVDVTDPRLPAALEERARTGRFRGELSFRRSDGTLFPGEVSSAIFIDRMESVRKECKVFLGGAAAPPNLPAMHTI